MSSSWPLPQGCKQDFISPLHGQQQPLAADDVCRVELLSQLLGLQGIKECKEIRICIGTSIAEPMVDIPTEKDYMVHTCGVDLNIYEAAIKEYKVSLAQQCTVWYTNSHYSPSFSYRQWSQHLSGPPFAVWDVCHHVWQSAQPYHSV